MYTHKGKYEKNKVYTLNIEFIKNEGDKYEVKNENSSYNGVTC